jgi:hypothetical protein
MFRDEELELGIPAIDVVAVFENLLQLVLGVLERFLFSFPELLADLVTQRFIFASEFKQIIVADFDSVFDLLDVERSFLFPGFGLLFDKFLLEALRCVVARFRATVVLPRGVDPLKNASAFTVIV